MKTTLYEHAGVSEHATLSNTQRSLLTKLYFQGWAELDEVEAHSAGLKRPAS